MRVEEGKALGKVAAESEEGSRQSNAPHPHLSLSFVRLSIH